MKCHYFIHTYILLLLVLKMKIIHTYILLLLILKNDTLMFFPLCLYENTPGQIKKKILVFRITGPYLNLVVKPRIFSGFSGKFIIYAF